MAGRINVCRHCSLTSLRAVARSVAGPISLILVREFHSFYFLRPAVRNRCAPHQTRTGRSNTFVQEECAGKSEGLGKQPSQDHRGYYAC
jgi:hypothetical protein